ncbi:expressed protein [Chlorella variabilis]|uniref:Expressed protein n=1 Tax=Chlorella variabilis TaxID=554065 RepID=E1ZKD0_CHLVA|nr:expressed protein [Chlorella variabilis]EFN53670.1 expressed protein [Chlorella variabilis]|eukprot:XP_005845772.1 expressed protein [Chlorella variabilis]
MALQVFQHGMAVPQRGLAAGSPRRVPVPLHDSCALVAYRRPPACRGLCCRAAAAQHKLPSAWVAQCLERAQRSVVTIEGKHYIPLAEAQCWFEAGAHEAEEEQHAKMDAVMAERGRMQGAMAHLAEESQREHNEHEQAMHRLLDYALALEQEVERSRAVLGEAAHEAAHAAEERLTAQYQQLLLDYEHEHEAEQEAVMASMRGQVEHLKTALHAAHEAKKQWRERALQVEQQFVQLRGLIESSLQQASDSAFRRQQARERQPPAPAHPSPRIRSCDEVAPADADVAVQAHPRLTSAVEAGPHKLGVKSKKHLRELI